MHAHTSQYLSKTRYRIAGGVAGIILALFLSVTAHHSAALNFPFILFGGRIYGTIPCLCSGGILMVITPPVPGLILFQPGRTALFAWWAIHPGAWTLGLATPGGICLIPGRHGCWGYPVEGIALIMGTSL